MKQVILAALIAAGFSSAAHAEGDNSMAGQSFIEVGGGAGAVHAGSFEFINLGGGDYITTFPATDPVAAALGAKPLSAEKSTNYALGAVFRLGGLNLTIDGYQINLKDRIVLSENLTQTNVRTYLTSLGFVGIGGGRFFINGVDSETRGVDIIANFKLDTEQAGLYAFTFGANFNSTEVTKVPVTAPLTALTPSPILFGRVNVLTFEKGTPESKFNVASSTSGLPKM